MSSAPLYEIPQGAAVELGIAPRKTSWDAGTSTAQVELGRYLDHIQEHAALLLTGLTGPVAIRLDVGLADGVDPLHEHDLDNFLHPVVSRLGGRKFVSAWATKRPGQTSRLCIVPAIP